MEHRHAVIHVVTRHLTFLFNFSTSKHIPQPANGPFPPLILDVNEKKSKIKTIHLIYVAKKNTPRGRYLCALPIGTPS